MAKTGAPASLTPQYWGQLAHQEAMDMLFWSRFIGTGPNNIIQRIDDLEGKHGNQITYPLRMKLTGSGVDGDARLRGNEEALVYYNDTVSIARKRFGVITEGEWAEKQTMIDLRKDAKESLTIQYKEWMDTEITMKVSGIAAYTFSNTPVAPSSTRVIYGGAATSSAGGGDLAAATCVFTTMEIDRAIYTAKTASPKIRPITIPDGAFKGREFYGVLAHPRQIYDLKVDSNSTWYAANRDANVRGWDNPIFSGAIGIWNGAIVYEYEGCYQADDAGTGSNVAWARALLLGAQAGVVAFGSPLKSLEDDDDYHNQQGFALSQIVGIDKTIFNSVDFGVIAIDTAAAAPTGVAH